MSKQPPNDALKKGTGSELADVNTAEHSGSEVPVPLFQPGQLTFEQSLERLDEIVHALEEGKLGLNESLERYEEGVKLLRQSYELLQRAERKIELLSGVDAEGNPVTQPFDDTATIDEEESGKRRSRRRSAAKPPEYGDDCP